MSVVRLPKLAKLWLDTTKWRVRSSRPLSFAKHARVAAKNKIQKRNRTLGLTPEIRGAKSARFWFPLIE